MTRYTVEMFGKDLVAGETPMTGKSGVVATVDTFEKAFEHAVNTASEQSVTKIHRFTQRNHDGDGWIFEADGAELLKLKGLLA